MTASIRLSLIALRLKAENAKLIRRLVELKENEVGRMNEINSLHEEAVRGKEGQGGDKGGWAPRREGGKGGWAPNVFLGYAKRVVFRSGRLTCVLPINPSFLILYHLYSSSKRSY